LITSTSLNLVRHFNKLVEPISEPPISIDINMKSVFVRPIKIIIPLDTFQQHLPETFFQHEVGKMEIDNTLARIKVQNLHITGWTIIEEKN
jgi:hypothetical protein